MNYEDVRRMVFDGDLIAVRKRHGLAAWAIRQFTGSPYTHTAIALWLDGGVWVAEMDSTKNVLVPLSQYAGERFEVYRCPVNRAEVRAMLLEHLRTRINYDWRDVLAIGLHHVFNLPLPARDRGGRICSTFAGAVYLACGWAASLPMLATPGDVVNALCAAPALSNDG